MPGGRPPAITDKEVQQLKIAFAMGLTDDEACLFAEVKRSTFYDYCSNNPDFSDLKEHLKKTPSLKAKRNILQAIDDGDQYNSRWWLERKDPDFSSKSQNTVDANVKTTTSLKEQDRLLLQRYGINTDGENNE